MQIVRLPISFLTIRIAKSHKNTCCFRWGNWGYPALSNIPSSSLAPDVISFLPTSAFSSFSFRISCPNQCLSHMYIYIYICILDVLLRKLHKSSTSNDVFHSYTYESQPRNERSMIEQGQGQLKVPFWEDPGEALLYSYVYLHTYTYTYICMYI